MTPRIDGEPSSSPLVPAPLTPGTPTPGPLTRELTPKEPR